MTNKKSKNGIKNKKYAGIFLKYLCLKQIDVGKISSNS